jgi:glycosyltransferase involved in cell wall biosynthesis
MCDNNNPLVTIITLTFNHENYIGKCIESVISQTYSSWEMIIIDDGSTDKTKEIVARYGDKRIRYERQTHRGVSCLGETYNCALAMARGELIAILEGDDWWPAEKLAIQVPDFADEEIVISYGFTSEVVNEQEVRQIPDTTMPEDGLSNTPPGRAARYLMDYLCLTFLFPVSVIVRRAALVHIGGFRQLEYLPIVDFPTFLRLSLEGRFVFHRQVLGFWRRHVESTTRNHFYLILEGVYKHISSFQKEHPALPIDPDELFALNSVWKEFKWQQWFTLGRWFLVDGEWESARKAFNRCWPFFYNWKHPALLMFCLASSYFHSNIEFLNEKLNLKSLEFTLSAYNRINITVSKEMLNEI